MKYLDIKKAKEIYDHASCHDPVDFYKYLERIGLLENPKVSQSNKEIEEFKNSAWEADFFNKHRDAIIPMRRTIDIIIDGFEELKKLIEER